MSLRHISFHLMCVFTPCLFHFISFHFISFSVHFISFHFPFIFFSCHFISCHVHFSFISFLFILSFHFTHFMSMAFRLPIFIHFHCDFHHDVHVQFVFFHFILCNVLIFMSLHGVINQSTNQSINQLINQSINQPCSRLHHQILMAVQNSFPPIVKCQHVQSSCHASPLPSGKLT